MSKSSINSLLGLMKKNEKEMDIKELLSTEQWIWVGEIPTVSQGTSNFSKNLSSKNRVSIFDALNNLREKSIPVVKKDTLKFGKVWTVDELAAEKVGVLEEAKFVNEKVYILNKNINNTFLFPELKRFQKKEYNLMSMSGGSLEKNSNGELIA